MEVGCGELLEPTGHVVLAIIQEKVNNPSPEDPFEPEIAAVSVIRMIMSVT